jgi:hypothetical protein
MPVGRSGTPTPERAGESRAAHRQSVQCDGVVTFAVFGGLLLWFVLAFAVALVVGRGIRAADRRSASDGVLTTAALDLRHVLR